jgi:quinol monooxygenase YgiN
LALKETEKKESATMKMSIAIACYRPHPGKEAELQELIKRHIPTLREEGLVTDREPLLLKAADGTFLEIFEWKSDEAKNEAHSSQAVLEIWEAMGKIADFPSLSELEEAKRPFPNFPLAALD